jgi:ankyrin repeat protein
MAALVCDLCGGKLIMGAGGIATCDSCGMEHSADRMKEKVQEIKGTVKVDNSHLIDNYLEMAKTAYDSSNQSEAEAYCNKIIEIDPTNYKAWLIKGKSAGWQSTLQNPRFSESVSAFAKSIQNAPEDEKNEIIEDTKNEIKNLSRALISLRAERFAKWPDEDEADGFSSDITSILNAMRQFIIQAGVIIPLSEMMEPIATQINQSVVQAWQNKILPDYKGDENRPDKYKWKQFIERIGHCTSLVAKAIDLCDEDAEADITRYENLIFFHEQAINSCSWDYEFVGSFKRWHKEWSLTDEAKASRRKLIAQYKNKIEEIKKKVILEDNKGKTINELLVLAFAHLQKHEHIESTARFDAIIEKLPNERLGYLGKAATLADKEADKEDGVTYDTLFAHVLIAKDKAVSPEYESDTKKLLDHPCGQYGFTMLMFACEAKRLNVVQALLDMGADIHKKTNLNNTALWFVCCKALPADKLCDGRKIAQILLDMGAEVDITNKFGVALYNKTTDSEIVRMILAKYPNLKKGRATRSSGGCYVATCVYGSYDCPQVWTLRRYRDDTLGSTWYGRWFIRTYYAISPTLVKWFGNTNWFKKLWKGKLDRMVTKLHNNGVEDTPYKDKEW